MQEHRTSANLATANRLALSRRAKRGLVAGYIHEISGRHQHAAGAHMTRPASGDAATVAPTARAPEPRTA